VSGWTRCAIQVCRRRTKQEIPDWGLEKGERRRADDQTPPRQIIGMGAYMYSRRLLLLLFGLAPAASIEYFSSTDVMTQSDAKDWCAWNGGELAVIKSADENDDAQAACGSTMCWIGLEEDDDYSGEWYWADGTMASAIYTNWESGEPNNYGGQDEKFAMMNCCGTSASSTGKWYDAPGTYDEPVALCSNKSPTVLPVPVPTMLPTLAPTKLPTLSPTALPTFSPTALPTGVPTSPPTLLPTGFPTSHPTELPTISFSPTGVPTPQKVVALTALYKATNGSDWTANGNWMIDGDPCSATASWYGVKCTASNAAVRKLHLESNNMAGSIPSQIGLLVDMTRNLKLEKNSLVGTLPTQLGMLSELTAVVYLYNNKMSGPIPSELGMLSKLEASFLLYGNAFSSLPTEVGQCTAMISAFRTDKNSLTGTVPSKPPIIPHHAPYPPVHCCS
jgi:hypothetical protein